MPAEFNRTRMIRDARASADARSLATVCKSCKRRTPSPRYKRYRKRSATRRDDAVHLIPSVSASRFLPDRPRKQSRAGREKFPREARCTRPRFSEGPSRSRVQSSPDVALFVSPPMRWQL